MERILNWRISQTPEDLLAISEPFRPTPLQCISPEYPYVIDFINWPSIRHQMLTLARWNDLDTMCRDVVLNTVIEIPQSRAAVNIHDLLFNHIMPKVNGGQAQDGRQSMLHDPSWVYVQVKAPADTSFDMKETASTDQILLQEIAERMSRRHLTQQDDHHITAVAQDSLPAAEDESCAAALASFGVHDPLQWKLSRHFARKYPYMDCSSGKSDTLELSNRTANKETVISRFEMVSCTTDGLLRRTT